MCSLVLFENLLPDMSQKQTGIEIADIQLYTVLYGMYAIAFAIPCIFIVKGLFGKRTIHQLPENAQTK
jgi:hypothetical protein